MIYKNLQEGSILSHLPRFCFGKVVDHCPPHHMRRNGIDFEFYIYFKPFRTFYFIAVLRSMHKTSWRFHKFGPKEKAEWQNILNRNNRIN